MEGQKRCIEEGIQGMDAKRPAGGETIPVPIDISGGARATMKSEDFSAQLLKVYYERLFPFSLMTRWLSYKNDPRSSSNLVQKDFFLRREWTFVLEGDIFCRYMCFKDADEFRAKVLAQQPIRMEIGAVFSHPPKNHNIIIKEAYKPLERELVFDIDMDDYDEIRTCCTGSKLCKKCWTFMRAAMKILDRALREDFGFKHLLFVYSGRRGMHCWVSDQVARQLSNDHRSAVAEYLNFVTGGTNKGRTEIKTHGCEELHPAIIETYKICERFFRDDPNGVLQGQEILTQGPHLKNILQALTAKENDAVADFMKKFPHATSRQIWGKLEELEQERASIALTFKQKMDVKRWLKEIVLQFTCPRLDINVSKQMNHLLKAPFVVHPKTGRVCVPIDPDKADEFDPGLVPTIGRLVDEINASGDARNTSLKEYTHFFETAFIVPIEKEIVQEMRGGDLSF